MQIIIKSLYSQSKTYAFKSYGLYKNAYNCFSNLYSKSMDNFEIKNRDGIYITTSNGVESLTKILDIVAKHKINITQIETKVLEENQKTTKQDVMFRLNFEGMIKDQNLQACINELKSHYIISNDESVPVVPWFPRTLEDVDKRVNLLERNEEAKEKSPTYKDREYKTRRDYIGNLSKGYKLKDPIPYLPYTDMENKTWNYIYEKIRPVQRKYMIKQFNDNLDKLAKLKIMTSECIPQQSELNKYLWNETGFRLKPVHGILSQREFLNALAHRVFCCTQYIRHHASPEYSPEPDIVHEYLGHIAMFIEKDFAELSQQIGLYSLGATEDQIDKLGALYLYTIEFGVCKENSDIKAYGAGIAGSISELEYFGQGKAEIRKLDPQNDLPLDFPIHSFQPVYFVSETFKEATDTLIKYGEALHKPFQTSYCSVTNQVNISRNIKTRASQERNIYESLI